MTQMRFLFLFRWGIVTLLVEHELRYKNRQHIITLKDFNSRFNYIFKAVSWFLVGCHGFSRWFHGF